MFFSIKEDFATRMKRKAADRYNKEALEATMAEEMAEEIRRKEKEVADEKANRKQAEGALIEIGVKKSNRKKRRIGL